MYQYLHLYANAHIIWKFPRWLSGKESACNAGSTGDMGSNPGCQISPSVGNGNPLQNSCLENPMGRGVCQAIVNRVAKNWLNVHVYIIFNILYGEKAPQRPMCLYPHESSCNSLGMGSSAPSCLALGELPCLWTGSKYLACSPCITIWQGQSSSQHWWVTGK